MNDETHIDYVLFPPEERTLLEELRRIKAQKDHHFTASLDGRRLLVTTAHGVFTIDIDRETKISGVFNHDSTDALRVFGALLEKENVELEKKAFRLDSANVNLHSKLGVAALETVRQKEQIEDLKSRVRKLEIYSKGLNTRVRNLKAKGAVC